MLRFIMKKEVGDSISNYRGHSLHTVELDVPELEEMLRSGGFGESGFESTELLGVEVCASKSKELPESTHNSPSAQYCTHYAQGQICAWGSIDAFCPIGGACTVQRT